MRPGNRDPWRARLASSSGYSVNRIWSILTSHPIQQFRRDRRFYLRYDSFWFVVCALAILVLLATRFNGLFGRPSAYWLLVFPPLLYGLIVAHLFMHNATHGNFPRAINRVLGELFGLLVVVRYASWDIVHMRHHKYSDDRETDPHPNFASFWKTLVNTIINVEIQLQHQYFETWGDTPENRAFEKFRARVSYGTNIVLGAAWMLLLGPWFFWMVFIPANLLAAAFVIHFNWSTHNGMRGDDFRPVNLNSGYFWLGNKLFAGIYMHANHHQRPHLFNPLRWDERKFGPADEPVDRPQLPSHA
jgi:fatty acid desaturase